MTGSNHYKHRLNLQRNRKKLCKRHDMGHVGIFLQGVLFLDTLYMLLYVIIKG